MRKRSIANLLSRNCKRGLDRKWKLPERRRLRQARQFRKERKRLSLTPSSQFFNQRLDPVGPSTIRWPHRWPRARCVLRAVRWDDRSCAEFWEEFSEAVVAGDSCSGASSMRQAGSSGPLLDVSDAAKPHNFLAASAERPIHQKKSPSALQRTRRFELPLIISLAKPPGWLLLSLLPCPPSLPRLRPTWCK